MIIAVFIGAFWLIGAAAAGTSGGGSGGGHGGGGAHAGSGAGHAGAGHALSGHASAELGSRIASIGRGTREESELSKMGFAEAHHEMVDGHHATVAVFHHDPLTLSDRESMLRHHFHFKGFNECAGHGACPGENVGEETYCRSARNAAITGDLECLSFRK
jgi:hypothetical protein